MRKKILALMAIILTGGLAYADGIPRCWRADQPGQDIEDGMFRVFIPTEGHDAESVARVLVLLSHSEASQAGVGSPDSIDRIEIDMDGVVKYWQPSGSFPTLDSYKDFIVESLTPALSEPGVTVECSQVSHPMPSPLSR